MKHFTLQSLNMARQIVLLIVLFFIIKSANSQTASIHNDSISSYYKRCNSFEVFYYYYNKPIHESSKMSFDFKEAYYDDELKTDLMTLLNEDEYLEYRLSNYKKEQKEKLSRTSTNYNESLAKWSLSQWLKKQTLYPKITTDSIWKSSELYEKHIDLVLDWLVLEKKEEIINRKDLMPPYEILAFHSQIAYPEFYTKLKHWILSNDLHLLRKDKRNIDPTYTFLLWLNDPEALEILNGVINIMIEKKGKESNSSQILGLLEKLRSPYAIDKLIELSDANFNIVLMSSDDSINIEIYALSILANMWDSEFLDNEDYTLRMINNLDSTYLKKNKQKILSAALNVKQIYKKKQEYWMTNMPFYKKLD